MLKQISVKTRFSSSFPDIIKGNFSHGFLAGVLLVAMVLLLTRQPNNKIPPTGRSNRQQQTGQKNKGQPLGQNSKRYQDSGQNNGKGISKMRYSPSLPVYRTPKNHQPTTKIKKKIVTAKKKQTPETRAIRFRHSFRFYMD